MDKIPKIWFLKQRVQSIIRFKLDRVELITSPVEDIERLRRNFPSGEDYQQGIIDVTVRIQVHSIKTEVVVSAENFYKQYKNEPFWRIDGDMFRDDLTTSLRFFRGSSTGRAMKEISENERQSVQRPSK